mgnify:CR=1 FL=1
MGVTFSIDHCPQCGLDFRAYCEGLLPTLPVEYRRHNSQLAVFGAVCS